MPTENFPELKNDRLLRAALREETDSVPVWLMGQAGYYLPEFRKLLSKHDFTTICETPELAAEVTIQPVRRFNVDAAILFSDILVIPKALGMTVKHNTGIGPVILTPLESPKDTDYLESTLDINLQLDYVLKTITLARHKLKGKVPIIGFSNAPFTLMGYMIEGSESTTLSRAKTWLYKYPDECKKLLSLLTDVVVDFLTEQVVAGAQMVQVIETSSKHLGPDLFRDFSYPHLLEVCRRVKGNISLHGMKDVPVAVYAKGAHFNMYELTNDTCYDVVGLDWTIDPLYVRYLASLNTTLQGNLDPNALYASKEDVMSLTKDMVIKFGKRRYIANLGNGVLPNTDPDHVKAFVDAVHAVRSPW